MIKQFWRASWLYLEKGIRIPTLHCQDSTSRYIPWKMTGLQNVAALQQNDNNKDKLKTMTINKIIIFCDGIVYITRMNWMEQLLCVKVSNVERAN